MTFYRVFTGFKRKKWYPKIYLYSENMARASSWLNVHNNIIYSHKNFQKRLLSSLFHYFRIHSINTNLKDLYSLLSSENQTIEQTIFNVVRFSVNCTLTTHRKHHHRFIEFWKRCPEFFGILKKKKILKLIETILVFLKV